MDFERAALKAFFYDFPIEEALHFMNDFREEDAYISVVPQLVRWRERTFSISETQALGNWIKESWKEKGINRFFQALFSVSRQFLVLDSQKEPNVAYDNLLRWHSITSCIGEDILTVPFIVSCDNHRLGQRYNFLWKSVIPHDNKALNKVLNEGLVDVHAHFNATVDVFHLNWLSLMNLPVHRNFEQIEKQIKQLQEIHINPLSDNKTIYSLKDLIIVAAYLRLNLFLFVNGKQYNLNMMIINRLLADPIYSTSYALDNIVSEISIMSRTALKDADNNVVDYAIKASRENIENKDNINTVFVGERELLYRYLQRWYARDKEARLNSKYLYLYLLIKNTIRKEFVYTNSLLGFENFQIYQDRKTIAIREKEPLGKHYIQYVAQTSVGNDKDKLEGRIIPQALNYFFRNRYIGKSVYSSKKIIDADQVSLVVHFIKEDYLRNNTELQKECRDNISRYASLRRKTYYELNAILDYFDKQKKYGNERRDIPKLTGIDAAGREMNCRPEVFAHLFRYAKDKGIQNRTYHVGEDFYDILDGLRAIDEAILFLDMDSHSRIGHASVLGTNALDYYRSRYFRAMLPMQNLLDNLVWCYYRNSDWSWTQQINQEYIKQEAYNLYVKIGYQKYADFDILHYWHSMLLRGNDIDEESEGKLTLWERSSVCHNVEIEKAKVDVIANNLYQAYHRSGFIKENGAGMIDIKYPSEIVSVVSALQEKMIYMIAEKQIAIECNPTSNLSIGHIYRYDNHPIFSFYPVNRSVDTPAISVSINTDDAGIFATSIYNEYSLIALAMRKKRNENGERCYSDEEILNYIEQIRQKGIDQCFHIDICKSILYN